MITRADEDVPTMAPQPTHASKITVMCDITPADALLTIDGKPVPRDPSVPCATRLEPGTHKVVVSDGKERYPRDESIFTVPSGGKEMPVIRVNLEKKLGALRVRADRPILLSVDSAPFLEGDRVPLRAGPHRVDIKAVSDSECFLPSPTGEKFKVEQGHILVDIQEATTTVLPVTFSERSPRVLVVYPHINSANGPVVIGDAQVKIDDRIVTRTDGGNAYSIGCGAKQMTATRANFGEAHLDLKGKEAAKYMRDGTPWLPILAQKYLLGRHVDCHEVTVAEFAEYVRDQGESGSDLGANQRPRSFDNPSLNWNRSIRKTRLQHPVNAISYEGALQFCRWRADRQDKARTGRVANQVDLLVAAGYEKSDKRHYPWGDSPQPTCERVHMKESEGRDGCAADAKTPGTTQEVCKMPPESMGPYGHCDLLGNVAEWVSPTEVFGGSYRDSPASGRFDLHNPSYHPPGPKPDMVGFRCAWDLQDGESCNCLDREHRH